MVEENASAAFDASCRRLTAVFPDVLTSLLARGAHYADAFYERSRLQHGRWIQRARGRLSPPDVHIRSGLVEGVALHAHRTAGNWFAARAGAMPEAVQLLARELPPAEVPEALVFLPTPAAETALRALLEHTADSLLSHSDQVTDVRIETQARLRQTLLVNTDGLALIQTQPLTEIRAEVDVQGMQGRTTGIAQRAVMGLVDEFADDTPACLARDAFAQAQRLMSARVFVGGTYPVVLASGWGGAWLHEVIGHRLEADVAATDGAVSIRDQIAPRHVTLVDDGTHPDGRASSAHDDEGTAMGKTTLIREGECLQWLTDRARADQLELPRTGNGRRASYAHPPLPRMSNFYLASGRATADALIQSVKEGLFAHQLGQGVVDTASRTYRVQVREGSRIEQGRLTHTVRNMWLEGSIDDALYTIRGVADNSALDLHRGRCLKHGQLVPVGCGLPTTLLSGIRVIPS